VDEGCDDKGGGDGPDHDQGGGAGTFEGELVEHVDEVAHEDLVVGHAVAAGGAGEGAGREREGRERVRCINIRRQSPTYPPTNRTVHEDTHTHSHLSATGLQYWLSHTLVMGGHWPSSTRPYKINPVQTALITADVS